MLDTGAGLESIQHRVEGLGHSGHFVVAPRLGDALGQVNRRDGGHAASNGFNRRQGQSHREPHNEGHDEQQQRNRHDENGEEQAIGPRDGVPVDKSHHQTGPARSRDALSLAERELALEFAVPDPALELDDVVVDGIHTRHFVRDDPELDDGATGRPDLIATKVRHLNHDVICGGEGQQPAGHHVFAVAVLHRRHGLVDPTGGLGGIGPASQDNDGDPGHQKNGGHSEDEDESEAGPNRRVETPHTPLGNTYPTPRMVLIRDIVPFTSSFRRRYPT